MKRFCRLMGVKVGICASTPTMSNHFEHLSIMPDTLTGAVPKITQFSRLQAGLMLKATAILANTIEMEYRVDNYHVSDEIQKRLARGEKVAIELQEWLSVLEELSPAQLLVIVEAIAAYITSQGGWGGVE